MTQPATNVALGRFRKRDDGPGEQGPPDSDLVEALLRAGEAAANGSPSANEERRRAAAAIRAASSDELAAAATALSGKLGAAPINDARIAAVERLTELRAAGEISEENFAREKQRILDYG